MINQRPINETEIECSSAKRDRTRGLGPALYLAAGLQVFAAAVPSSAHARGFISFHFGVPVAVGAPVYYPPPVYYYPPPVYYYPPPTYPPLPSATTAPQQNCREYQTTTIIGGRPQPAYGTACLQPDGTWRVVGQ
jgi:hypothetical protein